MSFATAYPHTAKFEGGYANAAKDAGGETFRGISRVAHPGWEGWPIIDSIKAEIQEARRIVNWKSLANWQLVDKKAQPMPGLARLVRDYYEKAFYNPIHAWGLAEIVTDKLFDLNVNLSPKSAAKAFQRAVNSLISPGAVAVDGAVGPATLAAAKSLPPVALTRAIARSQERFYLDVTIPKWPAAKEAFLARARWIPACPGKDLG
jgi:lysozyme family protein